MKSFIPVNYNSESLKLLSISLSGRSLNGSQPLSSPGFWPLSDSKGSGGTGVGTASSGRGSRLMDRTETVVMIAFLNLFFMLVIPFFNPKEGSFPTACCGGALKNHMSSFYQGWRRETRDRVVKKEPKKS